MPYPPLCPLADENEIPLSSGIPFAGPETWLPRPYAPAEPGDRYAIEQVIWARGMIEASGPTIYSGTDEFQRDVWVGARSDRPGDER